jgi:hypothetical protein
MNTTHPNSKVINIVRTETFMDTVQTGAKEFMSLSRKTIGSYWKSISSKAVGSGLDLNEQAVLLPLIIDADAEDRFFREKVTKFYKEMFTQVPFGPEGRALQIGLLLDNSKPVYWKDKDGLMNLPIEPMDYIRYRHAREHPQVAVDKESSIGDPLKLYYIFDPEVADKQLVSSTKEQDEAIATYLAIKDQEEKVSGLLVMLGVDPRDFGGASAPAQRAKRLRELADTKPADFNKVYKTDNFELRVKIKSFLQNGIFKNVGDRIFEASTNTMVAKDMDEAVKLLQDKEYSERLQIWSANLQDITAKPKTARRKPVA